jgi:hypothetical protein
LVDETGTMVPQRAGARLVCVGLSRRSALPDPLRLAFERLDIGVVWAAERLEPEARAIWSLSANGSDGY